MEHAQQLCTLADKYNGKGDDLEKLEEGRRQREIIKEKLATGELEEYYDRRGKKKTRNKAEQAEYEIIFREIAKQQRDAELEEWERANMAREDGEWITVEGVIVGKHEREQQANLEASWKRLRETTTIRPTAPPPPPPPPQATNKQNRLERKGKEGNIY